MDKEFLAGYLLIAAMASLIFAIIGLVFDYLVVNVTDSIAAYWTMIWTGVLAIGGVLSAVGVAAGLVFTFRQLKAFEKRQALKANHELTEKSLFGNGCMSRYLPTNKSGPRLDVRMRVRLLGPTFRRPRAERMKYSSLCAITLNERDCYTSAPMVTSSAVFR